ncbi:hypothetical protein EB796_003409 [Bugula neritina]|uniref:TOR1A n=1 Tax=Bugula neritina TaxID=10212 RepID=A0A7J7KHX3_BUGNE|nr:hypothetical protein EB796_003409 [Bugula neritina]
MPLGVFKQKSRNLTIAVTQTAPNFYQHLQSTIYGQHIATATIAKLIGNHLEKSTQPLTVTFQGPTGVGKSYASRKVAEAVFTLGLESRFVHFWSGATLFTDVEKKSHYEKQIKDWVSTNISSCPHQLFVFDEVDEMPDGLLNVLRSYISPSPGDRSADYSKAIYIFIT